MSEGDKHYKEVKTRREESRCDVGQMTLPCK